MTRSSRSHETDSRPLEPDHPVVAWVRDNLVPLLVERWRPARIVAFDPPDRPASIGDAPVGLVVVSAHFEGVPMAERVARLKADLADAAPVRPLCLTPGEFQMSAQVPGPVLAAARTGVDLL